MPASGRHSHKGQRGKEKICHSIPASSLIPVFPLRVAAKFMTDKIWMGSIGGLIDFWQISSLMTLGGFFQLCLPIQSMTPNSHQSCRQANNDLIEFQRARPNIYPYPCTSPQPSSICWKNKKSAIQCMSQVTNWCSGCRDMLAQSKVRLFGWQGGELFMGTTLLQHSSIVLADPYFCHSWHHSSLSAKGLTHVGG